MSAKLFLICGKAASGKSTLAARLAAGNGAILLSEDAWLSGLFGEEMRELADFIRCSRKLRAVIGPHVAALLAAGQSVVLDFQANTVKSRAWMLGIAQGAGVEHELHWLDVADEECKARLRQRNASGSHVFQLSEAQFDQLTAYFEAPDASEGLEIIRH